MIINILEPKPKRITPRQIKPTLTPEQKQGLIAQALQTDEGRKALCDAMVEPIRRSLEHQSVGRKLLLVDDLPQGALARYERDVAAVVNCLIKKPTKKPINMG